MGGVINIITRKGKGAPRNQGRLGFAMTPIQGLSIEPSVVFVGSRFSSPGELYELASYTRYQEVHDYGTAGRSFYAGLRATW